LSSPNCKITNQLSDANKPVVLRAALSELSLANEQLGFLWSNRTGHAGKAGFTFAESEDGLRKTACPRAPTTGDPFHYAERNGAGMPRA